MLGSVSPHGISFPSALGPFWMQSLLGGGTEGRQSWVEEAFSTHLEINRDFYSWLQGMQPALTQTWILTCHFRGARSSPACCAGNICRHLFRIKSCIQSSKKRASLLRCSLRLCTHSHNQSSSHTHIYGTCQAAPPCAELSLGSPKSPLRSRKIDPQGAVLVT